MQTPGTGRQNISCALVGCSTAHRTKSLVPSVKVVRGSRGLFADRVNRWYGGQGLAPSCGEQRVVDRVLRPVKVLTELRRTDAHPTGYLAQQ